MEPPPAVEVRVFSSNESPSWRFINFIPRHSDRRLDALGAKSPPVDEDRELDEDREPDEDGFQGAWFAANIVKVTEKDKFLIRYKAVKTDDNRELLTEEVGAKHVRPRPPKVFAAGNFSLTEEVDAFYNDGWWEGVIRKVRRGRRYKVYFKGTDDKLLFQHSDLRPRQDWIDRTWVMASQALKHRSVVIAEGITSEGGVHFCGALGTSGSRLRSRRT